MSKFELSMTGSGVTIGIKGGRQGGCLACNRCIVKLLSGAMPLDISLRHALPNSPARPREIAKEIA